MGTYIDITGTLSYKKENLPKIIQAVKDLNKRDDLKRGAAYSGGIAAAKWFAWIPEHYEDTVDSMEDILEVLLRFDCYMESETEDTVEYSFSYSDKWGQHEVFFISMAPYLESLGIEHVVRENSMYGDYWILKMNPDTHEVHLLEGRVLPQYPEISPENKIDIDYYAPRPYGHIGVVSQ